MDTSSPHVGSDSQGLDGKIVASGTLVMERKFIRGCGKVGHLEDIVVDKALQGTGVGKKLINVLVELSESLGAYKVSLATGKPYYLGG